MNKENAFWIGFLNKLKLKIEENNDVLAKLNSEDSGKSLFFAEKELKRCLELIDFQIQEISYCKYNKNDIDIKLIPVGVVLIMTPFSSPYSSILHKLIPSLFCGNKCLINPSNLTHKCTEKFIEIVKECLPNEYKNKIILLENSLKKIKKTVKESNYDALLFTGKSETAKTIKRYIGRKPAIFETGSMALAYVSKSVKVSLVAHKLFESAFSQNGMRCIAVKNIFINAIVFDEFLREFKNNVDNEIVKNYKNKYLSEFKNKKAITNIKNILKKFIKTGYNSIYKIGDSNKLIPMVLVSNNKRAFLKEMYGPVVCLHKVDGFNDIDLSYFKRSSLSSSIYSNDEKEVEDFVKANNFSGTIFINDGPTIRNDDLPFGGFYDENEGKENFEEIVRVVSKTQLIFK